MVRTQAYVHFADIHVSSTIVPTSDAAMSSDATFSFESSSMSPLSPQTENLSLALPTPSPLLVDVSTPLYMSSSIYMHRFLHVPSHYLCTSSSFSINSNTTTAPELNRQSLATNICNNADSNVYFNFGLSSFK